MEQNKCWLCGDCDEKINHIIRESSEREKKK